MRRWLAAACAVPASALAQPISNGVPTTADPAVVALVTPDGEAFCTASIIGPHTAITAAHCVAGVDARTLRVFAGSSLADGGTFLAVSDARMHPGFDPGGRDVALVTLRDEAQVDPLVLEPATLDGSLVDTMIRIVGFGITGQGLDDAGIKREGTAKIVAVGAEEIVAVPSPALACLGDSGGPALLSAGTIAGVVSRTDSECRDHAIYTRIDSARSILIDPYLAETAPGTAQLGDACLYDGHCADGSCMQTAGDPLQYVCAREASAGCGCESRNAPGTLAVLVGLVGLRLVSGRRRRTSRPSPSRARSSARA